jgi:hypothetical protein
MRLPAPTDSARIFAALALIIVGAAVMLARRAPGDDELLDRFLKHPSELHAYDAIRHLEAESLGHRGWIDARTHYSPSEGFSFTVIDSGGSGIINNRVLRPILQREKEMIATGESSKSALDANNYDFAAGERDTDGKPRILLKPRRREETLIDGSVLVADTGDIIRLEGRLAKNPSFWVKRANVVRSYERIAGANVPVKLESVADMRLFGRATMTMTYRYSNIDGQKVENEVK